MDEASYYGFRSEYKFVVNFSEMLDVHWVDAEGCFIQQVDYGLDDPNGPRITCTLSVDYMPKHYELLGALDEI